MSDKNRQAQNPNFIWVTAATPQSRPTTFLFRLTFFVVPMRGDVTYCNLAVESQGGEQVVEWYLESTRLHRCQTITDKSWQKKDNKHRKTKWFIILSQQINAQKVENRSSVKLPVTCDTKFKSSVNEKWPCLLVFQSSYRVTITAVASITRSYVGCTCFAHCDTNTENQRSEREEKPKSRWLMNWLPRIFPPPVK